MFHQKFVFSLENKPRPIILSCKFEDLPVWPGLDLSWHLTLALCPQVTRIRLVDDSGNIAVPAFYNYLTAWYSNDAMAYSASMANFHPLPKEWMHEPMDVNFESEFGSRVARGDPFSFSFFIYIVPHENVSGQNPPVRLVFLCVIPV